MSAPSFAQAGGLRMHYALSGPERAPVVVLSHSLGTNLSLWDAQAGALEARFRVLRYDLRGHGATEVTPAPYSIEQLGRDVLALLDALSLRRVHFCGLSIGGLIGIWLGAHAGPRIDRLLLCNTAARIGTPERWSARIASVRAGGVSGIAGEVLERWFTPGFRAAAPERVAATRRMLEATAAEGYVACSEAIRDSDLRGALGEIRAPTLVISGRHDASTPPSEGRLLAEAIAGARHLELEASHISNVEAADRFNAALLGFLG
jgi:3-oxoadipate enol-lactonase